MTFANSRKDVGNSFSHNHGSYGVHGLEITIVKSGEFIFNFSAQSSGGASAYGLTVDSAQLTTDIQSSTQADKLNFGRDSGSYYTHVTFKGRFKAGQIIRPHCEGDVPETAANCFFNASACR